MLIYSIDQIKRVCNIICKRDINPIHIILEQEQFLMAMQNWVKTRVRTNHLIDPALFTWEVAIMETIKMVNQSGEATSEADLKIPKKFKLSTKWVVFEESVDTYLGQLKGQGRVLLNYVIHNIEVPEEDDIFATEQELMTATAPLDDNWRKKYSLSY